MRLVSTVLLMLVLSTPGLFGLPAPVYPWPWFKEHLQLGLLDLPAGVRVELVPRDAPIADASIVIRNSSSTALYVIGQHGIADPGYVDIGRKFPPGIGPLNKIVDGHAYKWHMRLDGSSAAFDFAWIPEDNYDQSDAVWLDSYHNNCIGTDVGTVVQLKPLNQYGGHRPAHVDVPNPQTALLSLIYGTEVLSIPLTISYSLNQDYQPEPSSPFPDDPSPETVLSCLILALCLVGIGILLPILGVRKARR